MESAIIGELSEAVLGELRRLRYAKETIRMYRALYNKLLCFAEKNQIQHYSLEICERWLKESLGIDPALVVTRKEDPYKREFYLPIRVCQCLTEWQLHGCIALKKQGKLAARELPQPFKAGYESYVAFCREAGYSEQGTYSRLNRIKRMLLFFNQHGVSDLKAVSAGDISAFFKSQIELDSRTVATMLVSCRAFFRHLHQMGIHSRGPCGEPTRREGKPAVQASPRVAARGCAHRSQFDRSRQSCRKTRLRDPHAHHQIRIALGRREDVETFQLTLERELDRDRAE
jgi:hypothetical protein